MALKDWKEEHEMEWFSKNKKISIDPYYDGWLVSIFESYNIITKRNINPKVYYFKSESQALAYAKNYMRTHE